ncbi:hypothetical protein FB567DRAFT_528128 [Paraphoma chrysanthemicola]|uniref:C2H2-type domain-containing protein n=1 Tax=Paraphoma chrysanthemicola TaxID=798071 RepID=A0A8K0VYL2_9PLEO|nr:hypothetical protein FB567DRAFT_528128 [Paraphoma chrysanthemicola]
MPQSTASASASLPSQTHVTHAISAQPVLQLSSPGLSTRNTTTFRTSIPTNLPNHQVVGIVLSNGITGHDKYNCHIRGCSASFTRLADLKRHNGSRHNRERARFWCPVDGCERSMGQGGRAFPRKDKMVDHLERVHADKVGFGGK